MAAESGTKGKTITLRPHHVVRFVMQFHECPTMPWASDEAYRGRHEITYGHGFFENLRDVYRQIFFENVDYVLVRSGYDSICKKCDNKKGYPDFMSDILCADASSMQKFSEMGFIERKYSARTFMEKVRKAHSEWRWPDEEPKPEVFEPRIQQVLRAAAGGGYAN